MAWLDEQKLFDVILDWEIEAEIAFLDDRVEVAIAIRNFIKDLYEIIPAEELTNQTRI